MKPTNYKNLALAGITAAVLTACSSGGTCGSCAVPVPAGSNLIFVAPSILPSLANTTGVNYMGVYNPTTTAISNISYSLGQIVGSGSSVTLDQNSAKTCANIAAKSSCFLKLSVPESTIAGGAVVTASNSDGTEAATPLAIGVQQVPYIESANANGVGLYFYPKAQYSESGVPFMLATAVVQSPNVGNINTIELVDESGNLITGQYVTSGNSGAGAATLTMGSVVQIVVPLPQGVNLSQNYKVRTSYQSAPSTLSTIAEKLGLANKQTQATSNQTTGTQIYPLTTQGNNINLQFTPNHIYLTETNLIQYGYLYNIGDLTASQIQVANSSSNVKVTAVDQVLNGQGVIKVTYELINTTVEPTSSIATVTAQNPTGQIQTSTGVTSQNVNPLPVPSPTPTPSPAPPPGSWVQITGLGSGPGYAWVYGTATPNEMLAQDTMDDGQFWVYKNSSWTQITGGASQPDCDSHSNNCSVYGSDLSANKIILKNNTTQLWKYNNGIWTEIIDGDSAGDTKPAAIISVADNATIDSMFVSDGTLIWKYTTANGWSKITDGLGTNGQPTIAPYVIGNPTDSSMVISGDNGYTFVYTTANGWQQINDGTNGTPPAPNSNTSYYGNSIPSSMVITEGTSSPPNLWTYTSGVWTDQLKTPRFTYGSPTPNSILISVGLQPSGGSTVWTMIGTSWTQLTDGSTHGGTQPAYVEGNNYNSVASNATPHVFYMIDETFTLWSYDAGVWVNLNGPATISANGPGTTKQIFSSPITSSIILADNQSTSQLWTYNGLLWLQITGGVGQPPSVGKEWVNSTNINNMIVSDADFNLWIYK
jgi:hypothetical protein